MPKPDYATVTGFSGESGVDVRIQYIDGQIGGFCLDLMPPVKIGDKLVWDYELNRWTLEQPKTIKTIKAELQELANVWRRDAIELEKVYQNKKRKGLTASDVFLNYKARLAGLARTAYRHGVCIDISTDVYNMQGRLMYKAVVI